MIDRRLTRVALLLFLSGTCALIYQVAWLRELRLVFGSSTAASAAVLATFMGGLGLGSALLGKRADVAASPLRLYAHLEIGVAVSAALTPVLLRLARGVYVALGGSSVLGSGLATTSQLLLTGLILGIPTFLMGGTLPAAVRAVETHGDEARRKLAVLYGTNTLGAVTGAVLANFLLLELYGIRLTLLLAALTNAFVGVTARSLSRSIPAASPPEEPAAGIARDPQAPVPFVLASAAVVGFVFLLMELVWYRMLAPLLGGTTFTFGLILAVALLGIGVGGGTYSLVRHRLGLLAFATSCAMEGVLIAVPFALGDRLAFLAQLLRPLGSFGFGGFVASWFVVAGIVVLPASLVAGFQFPLLVSLLGEGEERVARQVGAAYAWNTVGAIAGSVAGGFGLLVLLGSSGAWRLAVLLSALLGFAAVALGLRRTSRSAALPAGAMALLALVLIAGEGPTALWRQSPIGTGRVTLPNDSPHALEQWARAQRRRTAWEADGRESLVGLNTLDGYAFAINGKIDGNAKADAPRQVMMGLIGAALHRRAERAMVIGLGTGSTAGWLARVPTVEHLDVVELEPAIRYVAEVCAPVNEDVLANPKVRVTYADAREFLLTTPQVYDLVLSEPSNPFTAGIASLFTREFYGAIDRRLADGGLFLQWLQAYEVDSETVETVMRTLTEVYPHVDVWQTMTTDLLFVASREPLEVDLGQLRARLEGEPFRSALEKVWRTRGLEGFLSRFVAGGELVREVAASTDAPINTDDHNRVEFGFARNLGIGLSFSVEELRELAHERGANRPSFAVGPEKGVDWQEVEREQPAVAFLDRAPPFIRPWQSPEQQVLAAAFGRYLEGSYQASLDAFARLGREPRGPNELLVIAEMLAEIGDEAAPRYLDLLARERPIEAVALRARFALVRDDPETTLALLEEAFAGFRRSPWVLESVMESAMETAQALAEAYPTKAPSLLAALREPFSVRAKNDFRLATLLRVAPHAGPRAVVEVVRPLEPNVPWDRYTLTQRLLAYEAAGDPLLDRAVTDLMTYLRYDSRPFARALRQGIPVPAPGEVRPETPAGAAPP